MALEGLKTALGALRDHGLPLILLRERAFDLATAQQQGDYDLLAPTGRFDATILAFLESLLATRVSVLVHAAKPEKRLMVLHDEKIETPIVVDLWREHRIDVPGGGQGRTRLLLHDALEPFCKVRGPVLRMPPWLEVAVYVCHLFEKKKDLKSRGVVERLAFYRGLELVSDQCPPELMEPLRRVAGDLIEARVDVVSAARLGCDVLERLGLLGEAPHRGEARRWWRRRRRRGLARRLGCGPVIAIQGPDGSGKTTVIEQFTARPLPGGTGMPLKQVVFKRLYRRSIFRWLYKLVRKLRRLRDRDEPKELVEVALAPFLFAGAWINYRLMRLFSSRGRTLLMDRFFPDLLLTNRKAEGEDLDFTRASCFLERLVPRIDCAVLLGANADLLRARKAEMSDVNTQLYLRLMCQHYVRRPPENLLVLRTDVPLERSLSILGKTLESLR